ncbi:MAG: cold shock domain-containing protein [Bacteroidetes bacterium]|nr:cold shock domain-containing protein [Bacteroidota bacterium]
MKYEDCLRYFDQKGTIIKWYTKNEPDSNGGSGYGFIKDDNNGEEYFVHISKYRGSNITDESFSFNNKKCLFLFHWDLTRPLFFCVCRELVPTTCFSVFVGEQRTENKEPFY